MRSLILCAAIAICTCKAQYVDYFNTFSNSDCTRSGIYCLNSTVRINCVGNGDGSFLNLGEYDCSKDMMNCCKGLCQDRMKSCSGGDNSGLQFQCSHSGTFPDLEECKKYHVCNGTTLQYSADCVCKPYDLTMGMCGAPPCMGCQSSGDCTDASKYGLPQPITTITTNTSFYFICINSTTYTFGICPNEETIMDINGCMPDCMENPGPFIDPNDCQSFLACNSSNLPQSMKCPKDEGYDDSSKSCVKLPSEKVPGCELNGTPTISTTDSTSSSTMSSTPTTSTTSTTGSPECPFQCEIPGNYSDSSSCHSYITCSSSLKATCNDCGSDYIYSPFYRQCVIGIC